MPNWCSNYFEIEGPAEDLRVFLSIIDKSEEKQFLSAFYPTPKLEGDDGWYDWRVSHWGTKWDIDPYSAEDAVVKDGKLEFGFDSAWAPPLNIYEKMIEQGYDDFVVEAWFGVLAPAVSPTRTGRSIGSQPARSISVPVARSRKRTSPRAGSIPRRSDGAYG